MWQLWSFKRSTLEVIEEEATEMEMSNMGRDQKKMEGNNTEGNDDEDEVNVDQTKQYEDCKDETDKELSSTEEEDNENKANENKDERKHVGSKQLEGGTKDRELQKPQLSKNMKNIGDCTLNKDRGFQKPALCVTFSQGGEGNSHQSEPSDSNSMGREEEDEVEEDASSSEPVWKKWKEAFSWNDFFYAIVFGLGPTSWDVLSDLRFGWRLAKSGDLSSAGLCYLFITIPGVFFVQDVFMMHIFKNCNSKVHTTVYFGTGLVATTAMALGFGIDPLLFQYPATILGRCSTKK